MRDQARCCLLSQQANSSRLRCAGAVAGAFGVLLLPILAAAQHADTTAPDTPAVAEPAVAERADAAAHSPDQVEVNPVAQDDEIAGRVGRILTATGWFRDPHVKVNEGVVFLQGQTASEAYKKWAGDLARNTRDVVAVVNKISVDEPSVWDSTEVRRQVADFGRSAVRALPIALFAGIVLTVAWLIARGLSRIVQRLLRRSMTSDLLRRATGGTVAMLAFLVAVYLVLQVAGLTRLALTLAGGTGLVGLALGIAFKEITENFLASIYLSIQKPFEIGDLVEINAMLGYVQRVTARTTILMTLDGNHVQIPNATVFKNILRNYTSNPNRRVDFVIGVGYDAVITDAQSLALYVVQEHPAVLERPEPWVLVDELGPSTVNLRVYFWLDGTQHSWLKVRSAVIRLTKDAFQRAGISLPDASREVVFPDGVPVRLSEPRTADAPARPDDAAARRRSSKAEPPEAAQAPAVAAEGNLSSEAGEIAIQASQSRMPEAGENLIASTPDAASDPPADKTAHHGVG